jgi:hypothetical protein
MTLHKNAQRGKCFLKLALFPFLEPLLKAWGAEVPENVVMCDPDCVLYRKGMRYWEGENKTEPFEECAINILADSGENQVQRVFALQKEMGEAKNAAIFHALAFLGNSRAAGEILRMAKKQFLLPGSKKNEEPV